MDEPRDDIGGVPMADARPAAAVPLATPVEEAPAPIRPWGFWATLGWSAAAMGAVFFAQLVLIAVAMAVARSSNPHIEIQQFVYGLATKGWFISLSTLAYTPVALVVMALAARWRRYPFADYLGLVRPKRGMMLKTAVGLVAFIVLSDVLNWLAGRPLVPVFMVDAYRTAGFLPLLVLAVCVAAPIMEESLFRGFMLKGIAASRAGTVAAVLIPAVSWAALHMQYDWVDVSTILAGGILLSLVRIWSGSLLPCLVCHVVVNTVATVETAITVALAGN